MSERYNKKITIDFSTTYAIIFTAKAIRLASTKGFTMSVVIRKATDNDFEAGTTVSFWYKDYLRTVMIEKVQKCKNKNVVVMGLDVDKNERRSFSLKEIEIDSRY